MTEKKEKKKLGRPDSYRPEYCESLIKFFDIEPIIYRDMTITHKDGTTIDKSIPEAAPTPYFSKWCKSINISTVTLNRWVSVYPEFLNAYKRAKELQQEFLMECGLKGVHNSTFSIFTMKNVCGWRDEQHIKTDQKQIINIINNGSHAKAVSGGLSAYASPAPSNGISMGNGKVSLPDFKGDPTMRRIPEESGSDLS